MEGAPLEESPPLGEMPPLADSAPPRDGVRWCWLLARLNLEGDSLSSEATDGRPSLSPPKSVERVRGPRPGLLTTAVVDVRLLVVVMAMEWTVLRGYAKRPSLLAISLSVSNSSLSNARKMSEPTYV